MAKNNIEQWSLTLLRIVLGVIFLYHGYLKLFVPGGFTALMNLLTAVKMPLPVYSALVVSVVEFIGGIFLLLGMVTRWTTLVLILEMLISFFVIHLKNGFLVSKGGYEFILLLLAGLVVLIVNGTGKLSLGKLFKSKHLQ